MTKTWTFNERPYTMTRAKGYGQYTLNGYHCTDSTIWDNCDNDDDPEKQRMALLEAEIFIDNQY